MNLVRRTYSVKHSALCDSGNIGPFLQSEYYLDVLVEDKDMGIKASVKLNTRILRHH